MSTGPTQKSLFAAYTAAIGGTETPSLGLCGGGVLNHLLQVTTYDPDKVYLATPTAIHEVVVEDSDDSVDDCQ